MESSTCSVFLFVTLFVMSHFLCKLAETASLSQGTKMYYLKACRASLGPVCTRMLHFILCTYCNLSLHWLCPLFSFIPFFVCVFVCTLCNSLYSDQPSLMGKEQVCFYLAWLVLLTWPLVLMCLLKGHLCSVTGIILQSLVSL